MIYKPHTVTVRKLNPRVVGQEVSGVTLTNAQTVKCQVTPGNAGLIYEQSNIEVTEPYQLLCEVSDGQHFEVGSRVTWDGETYSVKAINRWQGLPVADCFVVIMEKERGS